VTALSVNEAFHVAGSTVPSAHTRALIAVPWTWKRTRRATFPTGTTNVPSAVDTVPTCLNTVAVPVVGDGQATTPSCSAGRSVDGLRQSSDVAVSNRPRPSFAETLDLIQQPDRIELVTELFKECANTVRSGVETEKDQFY
jgi:hypothetical protein